MMDILVVTYFRVLVEVAIFDRIIVAIVVKDFNIISPGFSLGKLPSILIFVGIQCSLLCLSLNNPLIIFSLEWFRTYEIFCIYVKIGKLRSALKKSFSFREYIRMSHQRLLRSSKIIIRVLDLIRFENL